MTEIERRLRSAGGQLDWPPTPDLSTAVASRLRGAASQPDRVERGALRRRPALGRPLLVAAVLLLLLASGVAAAVPGVRDAVIELLGLQGATVERREGLPRDTLGVPPALGKRVTLGEAAGMVDFHPLAPRALPPPDRVYVRPSVTPGGELSLVYRARPGLPRTATTDVGLLVTEFRGDLHPGYVGKIAGQATRVERVGVEGSRAIWLEGAPHLFFYRDPRGRFREDSLRLAANVLLVERGRLLLRLEGALGLTRALALANSFAP